MTMKRLMTILSYGKIPVKPADISEARWNAMIAMAKKRLEKDQNN